MLGEKDFSGYLYRGLRFAFILVAFLALCLTAGCSSSNGMQSEGEDSQDITETTSGYTLEDIQGTDGYWVMHEDGSFDPIDTVGVAMTEYMSGGIFFGASEIEVLGEDTTYKPYKDIFKPFAVYEDNNTHGDIALVQLSQGDKVVATCTSTYPTGLILFYGDNICYTAQSTSTADVYRYSEIEGIAIDKDDSPESIAKKLESVDPGLQVWAYNRADGSGRTNKCYTCFSAASRDCDAAWYEGTAYHTGAMQLNAPILTSVKAKYTDGDYYEFGEGENPFEWKLTKDGYAELDMQNMDHGYWVLDSTLNSRGPKPDSERWNDYCYVFRVA